MIESIAETCGPNVGGLCCVQIVDVADVVSIPEAVDSVLLTEIVLSGSATVAQIEFPPFGGDFSEPEKDSDIGTQQLPKLRIGIPKDTPELGDWCNKNGDREVIALYKDQNGTCKILGDLEHPLSMKIDFATGTRPTDKNQFTLEISGISDHKAYYYLMFEKLPSGSRKVYSAGYTFAYQRT